ncbi:MAG: hypothetical protein EXR75_03145 [Myxococcales bacterium]|nr:hypothetical protein [Myxococcales bacterium]
MHWFFATLYTIAAVLFFGFMGWVVTRMAHLETANYWMGRLIVWDLYAVAAILSYVAFVGAWHLWEKLTGRMEPTHPSNDNPEGRSDTA